eukprot:GHVR01115678.1.p1 GENE.GHVR01115678.1~~GHVR01115678.1.p1  ORF type:complete len:123 (-),score=20.24 GHVR01115678.1:263-631(-)
MLVYACMHVGMYVCKCMYMPVNRQEGRLLQDVHPEVARAEGLHQLRDASGVQRLDTRPQHPDHPPRSHEEPINQDPSDHPPIAPITHLSPRSPANRTPRRWRCPGGPPWCPWWSWARCLLPR